MTGIDRLRQTREGRRLIVFLLILAAILGYLNWQWSDFVRNAAVSRRERPPAGATLVNAPAAGVSGPQRDFYVEARLERDRSRSEEKQLLQEVLADQKSTPEARAEAQRRLMEAVRRAAKESEAESLIRAKGFADAVVFLHDDGAVVVVRAAALRPGDAARIADAASAATGVPFAAVRITPYAR